MTTAGTTGAPIPKLTVPCHDCATWNRIVAARVGDRPKCGACGSPMTLDHPIILDDASFDRVVGGSDLPVLVDFYADWCGPCKMMAPAVDELARTMAGRALVAKVDTEAAPRTAHRFQIRSIPTTIVFRGGREVTRQSGAMPASTLRAMLA